jgi:endonuclease G
MQHVGYNKSFLGKELTMPKVPLKLCAPTKKKGREIVYTHFTLYLHKERKLPLLAAVNIRGEAYSAFPRGGTEPWVYSEQVDEAYQIDNRFYGNDFNTFDRGHMVRRVDPCWGPGSLSAKADKETFTWANCAPQHKKLNQRGGAWAELEQHIMENGVKNKIADISVFSGPVLAANDGVFIKQYLKKDVQVPTLFWKVIVWKKQNGRLYAVGFMMSQWEWIKKVVKTKPRALRLPELEDDYFENIKFKEHETYQVQVKDIENATGIMFNWKQVHFPFKEKVPQKIVAVPLKKVLPMRIVREIKAAGKVKPASKQKMQRYVDREQLNAARLQAVEANGQLPLFRRYELKGIQL